jgi:hypothetical protein
MLASLESFSSLRRFHLTFSAIPDDDTVDFAFVEGMSTEDGGADASELSPWKDLVGQPFGWGWSRSINKAIVTECF